MAKDGSAASSSEFLRELLRADSYKPSQGQVARKATMAALLVVLGLGVWRLFEYLRIDGGGNPALAYGLPVTLLVLGLWVSFRINNYQRFADFLISVEGEMHKVSWPTWPVLVRSSTVVMLLIFLMALSLFIFDFVWLALFKFLGVA